jgi:hypothetical protein
MLRELDMLISSGQGDNPEADAIRNRMEVTWMALSEGESHLLDLVSVAIGHP